MNEWMNTRTQRSLHWYDRVCVLHPVFLTLFFSSYYDSSSFALFHAFYYHYRNSCTNMTNIHIKFTWSSMSISSFKQFQFYYFNRTHTHTQTMCMNWISNGINFFIKVRMTLFSMNAVIITKFHLLYKYIYSFRMCISSFLCNFISASMLTISFLYFIIIASDKRTLETNKAFFSSRTKNRFCFLFILLFLIFTLFQFTYTHHNFHFNKFHNRIYVINGSCTLSFPDTLVYTQL